ncbi:hypothetical protein DFH09DRAFT_1413407 [Mycena vulgaris]|nr:hypothetical protein DFH09DRAFT_1413407 [Mycena vulgaris]
MTKIFDYVIIGGGTAGLALATRLAEEGFVAVDPAHPARVSAESAYLSPNRSALNLTDARTARILFSARVATGVQYTDTAGANERTAHARKERAPGAVHTPRLLELSGIGGKAYIPEGDHPSVLFLCETDPSIGSYDSLGDSGAARAYDGRTTLHDMETDDNQQQSARQLPNLRRAFLLLIPDPPNVHVTHSAHGAAEPGAGDDARERRQRVVAAEDMDRGRRGLSVAVRRSRPFQFFSTELPQNNHGIVVRPLPPEREFVSGRKYCFFSVVAMHPFGRGSAHRSKESGGLDVDLGFLEHEIDVRILPAGVEFVRSRIKEDAMATAAGVRAVAPATDVVSAEAMNEYMRQAAFTTYHPIGSDAPPRGRRQFADDGAGGRVGDPRALELPSGCNHLRDGGKVVYVRLTNNQAADMIKAEAIQLVQP